MHREQAGFGIKMRNTKLLVLVALMAGVSACSSNETCDDVKRYQLATEGKRLETPDDLDDLEALREMPLPEASPRPPPPEGSPCIDLPPSILSGE